MPRRPFDHNSNRYRQKQQQQDGDDVSSVFDFSGINYNGNESACDIMVLDDAVRMMASSVGVGQGAPSCEMTTNVGSMMGSFWSSPKMLKRNPSLKPEIPPIEVDYYDGDRSLIYSSDRLDLPGAVTVVDHKNYYDDERSPKKCALWFHRPSLQERQAKKQQREQERRKQQQRQKKLQDLPPTRREKKDMQVIKLLPPRVDTPDVCTFAPTERTWTTSLSSCFRDDNSLIDHSSRFFHEDEETVKEGNKEIHTIRMRRIPTDVYMNTTL